ncbi:unnamed protein product [Adineta steineri]|uniref:Uncharacterized protein n=1 Tax=Adineta steineri TaxID=433720 RepID=A0A818R767_9BILA|nr:unnamed protein product [Adineta steineri]
MNRLRTEAVEQLQPVMSEHQPLTSANDNGDDDIFLDDETNDDRQAHIRRRAPTRHSIKSLTGRKTASKQTPTTESKRKPTKNAPSPINTSSETKMLYNVPSVSQIAPLPQNKSHGTLPVLSLDGRDAPNPMQSETSENDLTHRICLDPTTRRQYSYSQSSVLSEGIFMDKNVLPKLEPGIYSTSLVDVDHNDVTTYHPLKKQVQQHQLTVEAPTAYNYRSRANTNIIERRFSNVEQPILTPELVCNVHDFFDFFFLLLTLTSKFHLHIYMPLKPILSNQFKTERQRSQNSDIELTEELHRTSINRNQSSPDIHEQSDRIPPLMTSNTPVYVTENRHRARRRSSVQILDIKLIQSLSNQSTSLPVGDNDSRVAENKSDDFCEL